MTSIRMSAFSVDRVGEAFFNLAAVLRFYGALFFFGAASGGDTREIYA
jgi:hypothetical protein